MKQYEAVVKVMEQNGGYATLGHLYERVLDVAGCEWKTKTPFASIRRIVQVHPELFFKVKPGLWALTTWRDRLPAAMRPAKKETEVHRAFSHSYFQGLIVELGNLQRFETHVPAQDKNKAFLSQRRLGDLASLAHMHPFSYPHIVSCAGMVDVVWFNARKLPAGLFEVEHSTDMKNSLVKFCELQDFRTDMVIVADKSRERQFHEAVTFQAFEAIRPFVRFVSYQQISDYHANLMKTRVIESRLNLPHGASSAREPK
jgi:hypothetical protein